MSSAVSLPNLVIEILLLCFVIVISSLFFFFFFFFCFCFCFFQCLRKAVLRDSGISLGSSSFICLVVHGEQAESDTVTQ